MQVQVIKRFQTPYGEIARGTRLKVREFKTSSLDFNPKYQIISGKHAGEFISHEHLIKSLETDSYTKKEYDDMKNHYEHLLKETQNKARNLQVDEDMKTFEDIFKLASTSIQVSKMLEKWLESEYEGDEKTDRDNFSIKLTKFIQDKLV